MAACADPALGGCDAPPVPVDVAEAAVREVLASLLGDPRHLHGYLQAAQRAAVAEGAAARARGDDTDTELRRLEATRARYLRLLDDAEPGSGEEAVALERLVTLKRELAALRAQQAARGSEVVTLPPVVTLEQVNAFLGRFKGQLEGDAVAFQRLVATLGAEHGLVIELLDDRRVRVSLALDAGAVTGGPRLVATAQARVPLSAEGGDERLNSLEWAARRNRLNPPACACGCGGTIEVKPAHRLKGMPRYIQGHHRMDMTAFVEAIHAEGLLTVSQAARELGIGETTLRRAEERGLVRPERRSWGGRAPMRLYAREGLEGLRRALCGADVGAG